MATDQATAETSSATRKLGSSRYMLLALGALGVVYGDIGTSPLYAFQDIFQGDDAIPTTDPRILGSVSLVFWTLMLVVSVKYVLIVMRADNNGEGGVMSLAALITRFATKPRTLAILLTLAIAGAALFYGDGMITPAVSVLSAVGGLEVAAPGLTDWVLPIALVVLIALFAMQRHGASKLGRAFGPVMMIWFLVIAIFGLVSIVKTPEVLAALNPVHAVDFFEGDPFRGFMALGSVVLCVTGAEALYADMGQFGRGPIRISWFAIVAPALCMNYFGQAALIIRDSSAASNPFYLMVPDSLQIPMVILATVATVIASQAVISGAFSMTRQAVHLGYLPRMIIRHTSDTEEGQIYVPIVNWLLMIAVVVLVLGFRTSDNLAAAYGIAVTGTFIITTVLITYIALVKWEISPFIVWPISVIFFIIDSAFFLANLAKFMHGGWLPLGVAAILFVLLTTWRAGRKLMLKRMWDLTPTIEEFTEEVAAKDHTMLPGTAIYLAPDPEMIPYALVDEQHRLGLLPERIVILHMKVMDVPWMEDEDRIEVTQPIPEITRIVAKYGFMERNDLLRWVDLSAESAALDPGNVFYVLHFITIEPHRDSEMWLPRQRLFSLMQRMVVDPTLTFRLPREKVVEVGSVLRL